MDACPICRRPVLKREVNPSAPFCAERCRRIDLAKWLTGAYVVPTDEPADGEGGADRKDLS